MFTCQRSGEKFNVSEQVHSLMKQIDVEKMSFCFDEEMKQMLSFWPSIGKWYKRKCDFSGETIVTSYPADARFPVYRARYFDGDGWTVPEMEYDPKKRFFTQLQELQEQCPRPHMLGLQNKNCEFCDDMWYCKNSYLTLSQVEADNIYFGYRCIRCSYCSDIVMSYDCDQCHSVVNCFNCFKSIEAFSCHQVHESAFMFDCRNCDHCFGCRNLRNKQYCIFNKQYSKEEYTKKRSAFNLGSRKELQYFKEKFNHMIADQAIHPAHQNDFSERCEGNYLTNCKSCDLSFLFQDTEDSSWLIRGIGSKNILCGAGVLDCEKCYHVVQSSYLYNCKNIVYSTHCNNSEYLDNCKNCNFCFACVGLKDKEYCIFNTQYTKEDYEIKIQEIKSNMKKENIYDQFFPFSMMYSGYNTTLARLYYPLEKEEVLKLGGYREDGVGENQVKLDSGENNKYDLEDHIQDVSDDLWKQALQCTRTGQIFNYPQQVIALHKKLGIPLSDITHLERIQDLYHPLTYITSYEDISSLSGEKIIHYYPENLHYKNIVSRIEYEEKVQ